MAQRTAVKEGEWVEVLCAFCEGTGKNPFGYAKCQVCGGRRKLKVKTPYYRCAYCGGTGRHGQASCAVCSGRGVVTFAEPAQVCPACSGYGKDINSPLRLSCPVCGGKGIIKAD